MKQVISLKQMDGKHKIIKKDRFKREVIFANPMIQGWWWEVKVVYCILVTFTYFAVAFCFISTSNNTDSWKQVQVEKMDAKVAWHCFILNLLQVHIRCILLLKMSFSQTLWLKLRETPTHRLLTLIPSALTIPQWLDGLAVRPRPVIPQCARPWPCVGCNTPMWYAFGRRWWLLLVLGWVLVSVGLLKNQL